MKKLMIAVAIVCAAAFANAASVDWMIVASDMVPGVDGTGTWSGTAMLSCAELGFNESVDVIDGDFSWMGTIESDLEAEYSFTLTATDPSSGSTYAASGMGATDAMYTGMGFVMAGTWTAVPEPTSGLLLLLGVAGLALKRKRA